MQQLIQARKRLLFCMVFSLYPLYLQADLSQQLVFNTALGFLPSDYVQAYPSGLGQCQSAVPVSGPREGFQRSGAELEALSGGQGVVYQAMFAPYLETDTPAESIVWAGDLSAMMVDELGRWRSDNGDQRIGSEQEDPVVASCFDADAKISRFSLSKTSNASLSSKCNALNFPYIERDLGYLWQADKILAKMTQQDAAIQRHPFQRKSNQRFIRTHIDQQEYDFVGTNDFPFQPQWFGLRSAERASQFIEYIRGRELTEWRSRTRGQHVYRLGDTLNAQPVHVASPAANFHLLYGDTHYQAFLNQYRERRSRVFLSTHDGMVHSFNAGWFDPVSKQIHSAPQNSNGATEWDLGQEIWAFIPFDIFPLLTEYAHKDYGKQGQEHLNLLSHAPSIFDARVFKYPGAGGLAGQADRLFQSSDGHVLSNTTHPGGWGTIMVTGFGTGGGAFATEDSQGARQLFQPAYLVFDITDAEQAPTLLAYIRHPSMGSSLAQPTLITQRSQNDELQWYLVLGSGTDLDPKSMHSQRANQNAKLFVYDLHNIQAEAIAGGKEIDLGMTASYVAGLSAADWQLDGVSDAVYVNATGFQGSSPNQQWRSALLRITAGMNGGGWRKQKLLSLNAPLSYRPQLSMDAMHNRWVYLATGRAEMGADLPSSVRNSIVGIKEPRDSAGNFRMDMGKWSGTALNLSDLLNVEAVKVNRLNGDFTGSLNLAPALPRDNVQDLERRLLQFSPASTYIPGWQRELDQGEAASAQGSVYGGFLLQATYQSGSRSNGCQGEGKNALHRLRFTTGTAWFDEHSATMSSNQATSKPVAGLSDTRTEMPGNGSLMNFLLQVVDDKGKAHIIASDQNGRLSVPEVSLVNYVFSGEVSWREL